MKNKIIIIPPDPEEMNTERALFAGIAIDAFKRRTRCDMDDAICDLICDIHHWCDRNGHNFEAAVNSAAEHYEEETKETPCV